MKNSNDIRRLEALSKYDANPKFCKTCLIKIEVKPSETASETRRRKFCSKNCSASFNNKGVRRHGNIYKCECGNKKIKSSLKCKSCNNKNIITSTGEKSLYDLSNKKAEYIASRFNQVRKNARDILERNNIEKKCKFCLNDEFKEILEVSHIKAVSSFDLNTKIKIVNALDNLMYICPSHHRMFDKGLIK